MDERGIAIAVEAASGDVWDGSRRRYGGTLHFFRGPRAAGRLAAFKAAYPIAHALFTEACVATGCTDAAGARAVLEANEDAALAAARQAVTT